LKLLDCLSGCRRHPFAQSVNAPAHLLCPSPSPFQAGKTGTLFLLNRSALAIPHQGASANDNVYQYVDDASGPATINDGPGSLGAYNSVSCSRHSLLPFDVMHRVWELVDAGIRLMKLNLLLFPTTRGWERAGLLTVNQSIVMPLAVFHESMCLPQVAFWHNRIYMHRNNRPLQCYQFNDTSHTLDPTPLAATGPRAKFTGERGGIAFYACMVLSIGPFSAAGLVARCVTGIGSYL
jgi:hypothetical protein